MTSITNQAHPHISFCPSSLNKLFSVQHNGKAHKLPTWQQIAIAVTGVVGLLFFGIGALFSLGLSYYFRTKLVEQLNKTEQTTQTPDPIALQDPEPMNQPVADNPPLEKAPEVEVNLKPTTPVEIPQGAPEAEQTLKTRIEKVRGQIQALRTNPAGWPSTINDIPLQAWSKNGRYFVSIYDGSPNYILPEFDETQLPKGIYCIYQTVDRWLERHYSIQMNQVMIAEFGEDNIYHLIISPSLGKDEFIEKVHQRQLLLHCGRNGIHKAFPNLNRENIKKFSDSVAYMG